MEFPVLLAAQRHISLVQRDLIVLLLRCGLCNRFFHPTRVPLFSAIQGRNDVQRDVWIALCGLGALVKRGRSALTGRFSRAYDARLILQDLAEKARTSPAAALAHF